MPGFQSVADLVRDHHPDAKKVQVRIEGSEGNKRQAAYVDGREVPLPPHYFCRQCGFIEGFPVDRTYPTDDSRFKEMRQYCKACGDMLGSVKIRQ